MCNPNLSSIFVLILLSSVTLFAGAASGAQSVDIINFDFNFKLIDEDVERIRTFSKYPIIKPVQEIDIERQVILGELPKWVSEELFRINEYIFNNKNEIELLRCESSAKYLGNKKICVGEQILVGMSAITNNPTQDIIDAVRWVLLHEVSHYLVDLSAYASQEKVTPNGILDPFIGEESFSKLTNNEALFHNISGHTEMDAYAFVLQKRLGWNFPELILREFKYSMNCERMIKSVEFAYRAILLKRCEIAKQQRILNAERAKKLFERANP